VTGRRIWLLFLGLGVLGSQAGHLLAYELRFGGAAQQVQSSGVHAYYPTWAKTSLGVVAIVVLAALLVIGLARVVGGKAQVRTDPGRPYLSLLAVLFPVQLALYAGQEVLEAAVAGMPADSAAHLVLWGTLGQLPVAVIAATALRWLLVRFESAVNEIRLALADLRLRPRPVAPVVIPVWRASNAALLLSHVAGASLVKRGPPSSVRFSLA
jgi:ABC-type sulfate transport system permease subunit